MLFVARFSDFERDEAKIVKMYTAYTLRNFCKIAVEIWKLQQKGHLAIDPLYLITPLALHKESVFGIMRWK